MTKATNKLESVINEILRMCHLASIKCIHIGLVDYQKSACGRVKHIVNLEGSHMVVVSILMLRGELSIGDHDGKLCKGEWRLLRMGGQGSDSDLYLTPDAYMIFSTILI